MPPEQTKNRQTHTIPLSDRIQTMMTCRLIFLILLIFALVLTGCKKEPQSVPEEEYGKPEPVFQVIPEDINNADSYDQPRIQFVWQGPNREKPEIWSIKIDGTDLRLAADKDLLYQGKTRDMEILSYPTRSPNNRYILIQFYKSNDPYSVHLIDLKNHTNTYLLDCQVWHAPWVGDSQSFFCGDTDSKLARFFLDTKKAKQLTEVRVPRVYVLQNSERIVQMKKDGFRLLDFNGREIRYEKLGEIMPTVHTVSKNGKYIMYMPKGQFEITNRYKVATLNDPKRIISDFYRARVILENPGAIVSSIDWTIKIIKLDKTKETEFPVKHGTNTLNNENGYELTRLTVFNEKD